MKIGTFFAQVDWVVEAGEFSNIEDAFKPLVECGLSHVDIDSHFLENKYSPDEIVMHLNNSGVDVASLYHSFDFLYKKDDFLKEIKEDTKLRLEHCAKIGSPLFMPVPLISDNHPDDAERNYCRDMVAEYMHDVVEEAKNYGITTILENFSDTKCPYSTLVDIEYLLGNVTDLYYAYDTGNFWFGNENVLDAYDMFASKTRHIHLKDICEKKDGFLNICGKSCDSVAIGQGEIPFDEIFKKLISSEYNLTATIEINDNNDLTRKTIESLKYIDALLKL